MSLYSQNARDEVQLLGKDNEEKNPPWNTAYRGREEIRRKDEEE